VVITTPCPPYAQKRSSAHCTGGLVGLRASVDGHGKSCCNRESIPGPSSPSKVPVTAVVSWPPILYVFYVFRLRNVRNHTHCACTWSQCSYLLNVQLETGINPLPALTHQSVLDLNAACRSKRTKAYWLFSS